jgi:hypothetical protein
MQKTAKDGMRVQGSLTNSFKLELNFCRLRNQKNKQTPTLNHRHHKLVG